MTWFSLLSVPNDMIAEMPAYNNLKTAGRGVPHGISRTRWRTSSELPKDLVMGAAVLTVTGQ